MPPKKSKICMDRPFKKKETVIFIIRSCGQLAGTERVILNWCRFIDDSKINIIVCAQKGILWEIFREEVPNVHLIDFCFDNDFTWIRKFITSLRFFENYSAAKVIYSFNGFEEFSFWDMLAAWIITKGNLYISHHLLPTKITKIKSRKWFGLFYGIGFWRIRKFINIYLVHLLSRRILAVTIEVKNFLSSYLKIRKDKIYVGCRGVDTRIFFFDTEAKRRFKSQLGYSEDDKVLISVSRISNKKRMDRLLGAFLLLSKNFSRIYLQIIGDGELKSIYENRVKKNRILLEKVKFLGFRRDVDQFIKGADFLLLASDDEGQSNVIKEAMACGTIPIVTDSPGSRSISNKLFVSKKDVFSFYREIDSAICLEEKELSEIRAELAREAIEKFPLHKCVIDETKVFGLPIKNLGKC